MSEPIKPGDLCVVVHDCCGHWRGLIFTVGRIVHLYDGVFVWCPFCRWHGGEGASVAFIADSSRMDYCPAAWLKKIPPLTDDEAIERQAKTVT